MSASKYLILLIRSNKTLISHKNQIKGYCTNKYSSLKMDYFIFKINVKKTIQNLFKKKKKNSF